MSFRFGDDFKQIIISISRIYSRIIIYHEL